MGRFGIEGCLEIYMYIMICCLIPMSLHASKSFGQDLVMVVACSERAKNSDGFC